MLRIHRIPKHQNGSSWINTRGLPVAISFSSSTQAVLPRKFIPRRVRTDVEGGPRGGRSWQVNESTRVYQFGDTTDTSDGDDDDDDDDDDDEDDVLVRISSPKLLLSMLLHGTLSEVPSGIEFPCQTGASIRAFGARLPFWPTSLERFGGSGLWLFCLGERGSDGLRGPLPRCLRSPLVPLRGLVSFLARCFFSILQTRNGEGQRDARAPPNLGPQHLGKSCLAPGQPGRIGSCRRG